MGLHALDFWVHTVAWTGIVICVIGCVWFGLRP